MGRIARNAVAVLQSDFPPDQGDSLNLHIPAWRLRHHASLSHAIFSTRRQGRSRKSFSDSTSSSTQMLRFNASSVRKPRLILQCSRPGFTLLAPEAGPNVRRSPGQIIKRAQNSAWQQATVGVGFTAEVIDNGHNSTTKPDSGRSP
jgi:hypothetical protein